MERPSVSSITGSAPLSTPRTMVDSFSKFGPELVRIRAWRRRDSDSVHNRASVVSPNRAPTRRRPEAVEPSAELGNVLPDPRGGSEFPVDKSYFDFPHR